jgi:hypothetical protein
VVCRCVLTDFVDVSEVVVCRSFADADRGTIPQQSERQSGDRDPNGECAEF